MIFSENRYPLFRIMLWARDIPQRARQNALPRPPAAEMNAM
jgi:hypothetical protein